MRSRLENADVLVGAVRAALQIAETRRQAAEEAEAWRARLTSLTPRQREVMEHIVAGQLNKQIAFDLGTSEQNIKLHRAEVMRKMAVGSLAELVRIAERLGIGTQVAAAAARPRRESSTQRTCRR